MEWEREDGSEGQTANTEHEVVLEWENTNDQEGRTLVGKLMTSKRMNKNVVTTMLRKGWNLQEEVQITEVGDNGYIFNFTSKEESIRILKGRPWSIQGFLLNLQPWGEFMIYQEVNFSKSPYWIQVHNIPLEGFNRQNVERIGEMVGEVVIYEDPIWKGRVARNFIRIRVNVNLNKPLLRGFWIPRPGKPRVWATVKYEKL